MANTSLKIIDSTKRLVFKFTGTGQEGKALKIDAGSLGFALNVNNYIMGARTDRKACYPLELKKIMWSMNDGEISTSLTSDGYLEIYSDGDAGNTIMTLHDSGSLGFGDGPDNFSINCAVQANSTGNIYFNSVNFSPNGSYSITLDFKKNPTVYDQGQTADPMAFNRGQRAPNAQNT